MRLCLLPHLWAIFKLVTSKASQYFSANWPWAMFHLALLELSSAAAISRGKNPSAQGFEASCDISSKHCVEWWNYISRFACFGSRILVMCIYT